MAELAVNRSLLEKVNRFFLLIVVPVLGILIPNITGLLKKISFNWWQHVVSYSWFIFISYAIWRGNILLLNRLRKSNDQYSKSYYSVLLFYFAANLLYTGIVTFLLLICWYFIFQFNINWADIFHCTSYVLSCVILINTIYEIVFLRQEMEDSMLKVKLLEMEKIQAELAALKSQIDPHFMFNSLNTLSYLISSKPDTAKTYNDTLAKVYRYILVYKDQNLVFLKEELEFVSNYFYLINIRYEQAVKLLIEIPEVKAENFLVIPASLQILIENAIKHNDFSKKEPLVININIQAGHVTVKNLIRPKLFAEPTSGIGLENLRERSRLITGKNIIINRDNSEFAVKVPMLKS